MQQILKDYPDILTVKQLQEVLNIGRNKTYELLKNNIIKSKRIGTEYRIPKNNVLDYLQN